MVSRVKLRPGSKSGPRNLSTGLPRGVIRVPEDDDVSGELGRMRGAIADLVEVLERLVMTATSNRRPVSLPARPVISLAGRRRHGC